MMALDGGKKIKQMKALIIIPAYNESESLEKVIMDIQKNASDVDYLVVNDCSTDDSVDILRELGASYIDCPVNLGIGGAVQAGYKYAHKNGYDIAIQFDGDGQHDARYIDQMVDIISRGEADVVIGSRFVQKEGFQSSAMRRTGINILSTLIWLMSGKRIKDVTSGFRAVGKEYITMFADYYPDDYPEPEVALISILHGGNVVEIPVEMRERTNGVSSINMKKSVYYMVKVSLAIIVCRISLGIRTGRRYKYAK